MATKAATQAIPRATYQDVLDAPPHKVAEIVDGTLHLNPQPASKHARASSVLGGSSGNLWPDGGVQTDDDNGNGTT